MPHVSGYVTSWESPLQPRLHSPSFMQWHLMTSRQGFPCEALVISPSGSLKLWWKVSQLIDLYIFAMWMTLPSSSASLGWTLTLLNHISSIFWMQCFPEALCSLLQIGSLARWGLALRVPFSLFQCRSGLRVLFMTKPSLCHYPVNLVLM